MTPWSRGVGFVTTVLRPAVRALPSESPGETRHRLGRRLSAQPRVWVLLALRCAAWMLHRTAGWGRVCATPWLATMLVAWLPFVAPRLVIEPRVIGRVLGARAMGELAGTMALVQRPHVAR